jgi:AcrR family transcriptional regulator
MADGVPNARGLRRRGEILTAARGLFSEVGYAGTTMAAIAVQAGVTHAGLLYHFASKQEVLEAVLDDERGRTGEIVHDGHGPHPDHLERLRALVARNVTEPEWTRLFSLLLGESVAVGHPMRSRMAERYDDIAVSLGAALGDLAGAGERPRDVELEGLARLLLAVMDGLQYQQLTGSGVDVDGAFTLMTELVRTRLATRVGADVSVF